MRIAQVTPVYPPRGGIGTVAAQYANCLSDLGDDVTIFTPRYRDVGLASNVKWLRGWFRFGNAAFIPSLIWKLRRFDIIHLHYPFYGGAIFSALAALIWSTPLIVTYHMKTQASGLLGCIFRAHRLVLEPFIFFQAKKILVSSLDYAQSVGLSGEKITELAFGVDTHCFSPGPARSLRQSHGIPEGATLFLFVGGMDDAHYFKGLEVLIHALSQLDRDKNWHAIFVGDGNNRQKYESFVRNYSLTERVHFVGRVSDYDLPEYFRAADAHLLPSVDRSEAFGLVTLEAASSGVMSIVSNLPGVRTLVEFRETGLLVEPGDVESLLGALDWTISHKDQVERMGIAARNRAQVIFEHDEITKRLHRLYKQVRVQGL